LGLDSIFRLFGEERGCEVACQPGGLSFVLIVQTAEGGFQEALHLGCGTGDGGLYVGCVIGDGEGWIVAGADFESATLGLRSGFVSVFVVEMDFDASELGFESVQDAVNIGFDQA
jgi:hypothetical protein